MARAGVFAALVCGAAAIDNGYGLLPPMGWRSWNCFGRNVNQTLMERVMAAMVDKSLTVDGVPTSMADLGYTAVGLDDNWQACGSGFDNSFHDSEGNPLVNTQLFPNMSAMTEYGHTRGLRVGWYGNNCICREKHFKDEAYIAKHMQNTVRAAVEFGFDGIKLDNCGQFKNLTWWAQLLNATGRPVMIENCHWGDTVPGQTSGDGPCRGDTPISDCPYNFFRTSLDIKAVWASVMHNLFSMVKFLGKVPLSRPGAWAYPDMLEVGRLATAEEDRSHFAAWVITSSPLILGHDVTRPEVTQKVWPIISNPEVVAVSQTWAGHPGKLLQSSTPAGCQRGKTYDAMQVWTKPLGPSKHAVFVVNANCAAATKVKVAFTGSTVHVRDVYQRTDVGPATDYFETDSIAAHDSRMYILDGW